MPNILPVQPVLRSKRPFLTGNNLESRIFNYEVGQTNKSLILCDSWLSQVSKPFPENIIPGAENIFNRFGKTWCGQVVIYKETLIYLRITGGKVNLSVAGNDIDELAAVAKEIRTLLPQNSALSDDEAIFYFWNQTHYGGDMDKKTLKVPTWETVKHNYIGVTQTKLNYLETLTSIPEASGRLILWHGIPGTGKTFSLRALARSWRDWCQFEYIIDPEVMLSDAKYMINVVKGVDNSPENDDDSDEYQTGVPNQSNSGSSTDKWRIVIMEDTGEVLGLDAKDKSGQGLSRLLNLSDGILGQGTKILFLLTTNDELEKIHPAVQRSGRCLSKIEFLPFNKHQALDWFKLKGQEDKFEKVSHRSEITLAEMFAVLNNQELDPRFESKIGFGG